MPIAHNHIILKDPFSRNFTQDKNRLYDAIHNGRLYVAIDSLQDATGFFFSARQAGKTGWMGDQLTAGLETDFSVILPQDLGLQNPVIKVYYNGQEYDHSQTQAYTFKATQAGAYRVEVQVDIPTFWGIKKSVIWIYSNPIYLR